jgi:hypothetical protein
VGYAVNVESIGVADLRKPATSNATAKKDCVAPGLKRSAK